MAIQRRSSEVWKLLEQIQHDFAKFGGILEKTHKKLQEATDNIENVKGRAERMQKRLSQAGKIQVDYVNGEEEAQELLGLK